MTHQQSINKRRREFTLRATVLDLHGRARQVTYTDQHSPGHSEILTKAQYGDLIRAKGLRVFDAETHVLPYGRSTTVWFSDFIN